MAKRTNRTATIDYTSTATPRATTPEGVPVFCVHDELMPIDKLIPNPRNPNQHSDDQIQLLGRIIRANGWRAPVTVSRRSGFIVKGHGRRLAALAIGATVVPVDHQDYGSEAEEWADLVADNRLAELAEMDNKMLVALLDDIDGVPIELTGYTDDDVAKILATLDDTEAVEDDGLDAIPAQPPTITQRGDLWCLGPHRLLCGDATSPEDVERLMAGELAQMVNTDPPYGVSYESQSGLHDAIAGDDLRHDDLMGKLLLPVFRHYVQNTCDDAAIYIWHSGSTRRDFEDAMTAAGIVEKQTIIWIKNGIVLGRADFQWAHEPCFYCEKAGQSAAFFGDRTGRTVWHVTRRDHDGTATVLSGQGLVLLDGQGAQLFCVDRPPKGKRLRHIRLGGGRSVTLFSTDANTTAWEVARETSPEHPTQKPVELATRAILASTQPGDLVIDFFGGSGSTLLGAETTGRRANLIELSPEYCDVIIDRYVRLTGNHSVRGWRDGKEITLGEARLDARSEVK